MQKEIGIFEITNKSINTAFWVYNFLIILECAVEFIEEATTGATVYANYISYMMFAYVVISIIICTSFNQKLRIIGIIVFFFAFIYINTLLFSNNTIYINQSLKSIILRCLPKLLLASCIVDFNDFIDKMEKYNKYMLILSWLILILTYTGYFEDAEGYMTIAYNIMLPIGISGCLAVKKGGLIRYTLFFLSAATLLFVGCRGAFIAVILLYIFTLMMFGNGKLRAKIITAIVFLSIAIFFEQIMSGIAIMLNYLGYTSRIITRISDGTFFQSTGRDVIRTAVMGSVSKSNYRAFGIFGDRYIARYTYGEAIYIHNIFLEYIIDYGALVGISLFIILLVGLIYCIVKSDNNVRTAIVVFAVLGFTKLMFSSSYLTDEIFYTIIGILFATKSAATYTQAKQKKELL